MIDHESRQKLLELAALLETSEAPKGTGTFSFKDCRPEGAAKGASKKLQAIKSSLNYTSPANPSVQRKVGAGVSKKGGA